MPDFRGEVARIFRDGTNALTLSEPRVTGVAVSPDGRHAVTTSLDRGQTRLWETATGRVSDTWPDEGEQSRGVQSGRSLAGAVRVARSFPRRDDVEAGPAAAGAATEQSVVPGGVLSGWTVVRAHGGERGGACAGCAGLAGDRDVGITARRTDSIGWSWSGDGCAAGGGDDAGRSAVVAADGVAGAVARAGSGLGVNARGERRDAVGSAQHGHQVLKLAIDVERIGDGVGDAGAEEFAVALAEAMHGDFDGAFAQAEAASESRRRWRPGGRPAGRGSADVKSAPPPPPPPLFA
jgi:hypothetical protein